MGLQLRFSDKYRLWTELIQSGVDRIFIESDQTFRLGTEIPVELVLPDLPLHIVMMGTVVGLRPASERFGQGIYVRFSSAEIEKCRSYLGLLRMNDRVESGRRVSRIDCALALRFLVPSYNETFIVKNISERGLLAKCSLGLILGQRVKLQVTLDNGEELLLHAEVTWARHELGLVGVKFVELPAESLSSIGRCIERLARVREMASASGNAILVAEDDSSVLGFLVKVLTKHGYQVQTATRGDDAIAMIRKHHPRLVLLDVLMPGIDGKDICKKMRADAEMAQIPVVLMSALDASSLHAVAAETGASDYMSKPVSMADLLTMVGKFAKP
jgi:CheY-like chemotaxis protein/Tfp pilus assembly protein PilZ